MNNKQAVGYGLCALKRVLDVGNLLLTDVEEKEMLNEFADAMNYFFDIKTEEEAEEHGWAYYSTGGEHR